MTGQEIAQKLVTIYGGLNAAAKAVDLNRSTFARIVAGKLATSGNLEAHLKRALRTAEGVLA